MSTKKRICKENTIYKCSGTLMHQTYCKDPTMYPTKCNIASLLNGLPIGIGLLCVAVACIIIMGGGKNPIQGVSDSMFN